jgi:FMN reductase
MSRKPFVVGIGGTTKPGSSTEQALSLAVAAAARGGARTRVFDGVTLARLPHYDASAASGAEAQEFVDAIREADGLILASPGYHGSVSGLVKNALDYIEGTAKDERVYLDGVPVGLIVTAYGWQTTGSALSTLRSIVHALRGWPTPLGAGINTSGGVFNAGRCNDGCVALQLETVGNQVVEFAQLRLARPSLGQRPVAEAANGTSLQ